MFWTISALVVAAITSVPGAHPRAGDPFGADKFLLMQASRACHVHDGAVYFIQHSRLDAPTIHTTRALGDTDAQITCVLQSLPGDLVARYRVDADAPAPPVKSRPTVTEQHGRRALHR